MALPYNVTVNISSGEIGIRIFLYVVFGGTAQWIKPDNIKMVNNN